MKKKQFTAESHKNKLSVIKDDIVKMEAIFGFIF